MWFHPQKQQIKNRHWKTKIPAVRFRMLCESNSWEERQRKLSIRWRKIWEIRLRLYFLSLFSFRCHQHLSYQDWPQGGNCANKCEVFAFSPFLMLIHTNNVEAGAVMGQFSLPIHPKLPEDKHLRTGGTREHLHWVQTQSPAGLDSEWMTALWGSLQITK